MARRVSLRESSLLRASDSALVLPPKCLPLLKVTALTFSLGFTTVWDGKDLEFCWARLVTASAN